MHHQKVPMISPMWACSIAMCCIGACALAEAKAESVDGNCLVTSCRNDDAVAEIYAPESLCQSEDALFNGLRNGQRGLFALDLNQENKGKSLEPINISAAKGDSGIVVDQYTRHLPPTVVPKEGGTVSFDNRFGENMECSPLLSTGDVPD
jgi:hypothetical protein